MTALGPATTAKPTRAVAAFILIAGACAALIAATWTLSAAPIASNRARAEAQAIVALTGTGQLPASGQWRDDVWDDCSGIALVRGTAAGYGGPIRWMLAARREADRTLRIDRLVITRHQETPGIADFLNDPLDPWLSGFAGHGTDSLELDGVSGATITSRALTRGVAAALERALSRSAGCDQ